MMKRILWSILCTAALVVTGCGDVGSTAGTGGVAGMTAAGGNGGSAGSGGSAGRGGSGGTSNPTIKMCTDSDPGPFGECVTNIYTLRMGDSVGDYIADEALVSVEGVITAVRTNADGLPSHIVLQVPTDHPDYSGPDYSGVWVYLNNARDEAIATNPHPLDPEHLNPPPVGTLVRVVAGTNNHFGQRQLQHVTAIDIIGQSSPPPPVAVSAGEVATDGASAWALEGVLVRVSNAMVTATEPEAGPGEPDGEPTYEFVVDELLRINDYLYRSEPIPNVGALFVEITGILRFGNNNHKVEPRNASDLNPAI